MRASKTLALVAVVFLAVFTSLRAEEAEKSEKTEKTEDKKVEQTESVADALKKNPGALSKSPFLYICLSETKPCFSTEADGCSDCDTEVKKVKYNLDNHMEVVGKASKALQDALKSKEYTKVPHLTGLMKEVASRIPTFDPPAGATDLEKYKEFTKQLADHAQEVEKYAGEEDRKNAYTAFRRLGNTCTGCHQMYRD